MKNHDNAILLVEFGGLVCALFSTSDPALICYSVHVSELGYPNLSPAREELCLELVTYITESWSTVDKPVNIQPDQHNGYGYISGWSGVFFRYGEIDLDEFEKCINVFISTYFINRC